jgi:signal transduction histidine kinase
MRENSSAKGYQALVEEREILEKIFQEFIHELCTPLTAIKAFADILIQHGMEDPIKQQEFLSIILKESSRLQGMIEGLLGQIRQPQEGPVLKRDRIRAHDLIEQAIRAAKALLLGAKIEMYRSIEEDLPPFTGDEEKLVQVLVNLISNAVEFSPSGARILMEADILKRDPFGTRGPFMHITVRDQGTGIPEEALPHIFDRYHTSSSRKQNGRRQGTGLGLSICRDILIRHQGKIWAESIYGSGSAFHIAVPLHPPILKPLQTRYSWRPDGLEGAALC